MAPPLSEYITNDGGKNNDNNNNEPPARVLLDTISGAETSISLTGPLSTLHFSCTCTYELKDYFQMYLSTIEST